MTNSYPVEPTESNFVPNRSARIWIYAIVTILIVVMTFVAYKATLFDFLIMDDFNFLAWLKETTKHPLLLWQALFHSYMNEPNYYRPLIILVWYLECMFFGTNGLCLRICSILFMLLGSVVLGMITIELGKPNNQLPFKSQVIWPVLSAALFAIYPLHVPVVNWFAAQHTPLVALFYLLSFWLYLRWRAMSSRFYLILSLGSFILAMLTEEMAVTLPAILFAYELFSVDRLSRLNWKTALTKTLLVTLPYWFLLTAYFCIRMLVLGTFICKVSIWKYTGSVNLMQGWLHGIYQILVPIDFYTIPQGSLLTIMWQILILLIIALSLCAWITRGMASNSKKLAALLVFWFVLSLSPADNIFATNVPNLLNFRVAYLATAPLCIFLAYGIANFALGFRYSLLVRICGGALLIMSALILYCNNWGLYEVGLRTNKVKAELQRYYTANSNEFPMKILGLPLINALYVSMLVQKPFIERNISDCHALDANYQLYPFGYLKELVGTNEGKTNFLYWDEQKQKLKPPSPYWSVPATIKFPVESYRKIWQNGELKTIINSGMDLPDQIHWENEGVLHIISKKRSSIEIDLAGLPCWPIDFICFKVENKPRPRKTIERYELHFTNDIVPTCPSKLYCQENALSGITVIPNNKEQELIFPLRSNPYWILGGKCRTLKLVLPSNIDLKLKEISLPNAGAVIPLAKGRSFVRLDQRSQQQSIEYDATDLKNCTQVTLEVIGPYNTNEPDMGFETLYSSRADKNVVLNIPAQTPAGALKIQRTAFARKGQYKARLRALDKNGEQVGLAGDHFLISVDE